MFKAREGEKKTRRVSVDQVDDGVIWSVIYTAIKKQLSLIVV